MIRPQIFVCLLLGVCCGLAAEAQEQPAQRSTIRVAKEVTFFTEPLDANGFVDYSAALNTELSKGVTKENNANVLIWKALGPHPEGATMPPAFFKWMGIELPPEEGDYFTPLNDFTRKRMGADAPSNQLMEAIYDEQARAMQQPWKRDEAPQIAAWLDANKIPLELIMKAAERERYFSPLVVENGDEFGLVGVLLPGVQMSRALGRAVAARAMLRLGEGEADAAINDLIALHRLARHLGQGATLVESLVGIAIDGIAVQAHIAFLQPGRLNADQTQRLQREFAGLPDLPRAADQVNLGERSMYLDAVNSMSRGGLQQLNMLAEMEGGDDSPTAALMTRLAGRAIDWNETMKLGNVWYDPTTRVHSQVLKCLA